MNDIKNLNDTEAIDKLKKLVSDIDICLFCTNLRTDDGATCRPMSTQHVCDQGNIWFFSEIDSEKNNEILQNKNVQLFYSHPDKHSYMVVNGEAEIILERAKIEELWSPMVKIWFPEGKDDPKISVIKVKPTTAYYWDTEGNKMINFFKMVSSLVTGTSPVSAKEGMVTI